eukprot:COSAG06_NODE_2263_length_7211_cov_408.654949_1_plen_239_part_00
MFSLYRCRRFSRVCTRRPLPRLRRGRAATTSGCWRCSAPRRPRPPPRRQPGAAVAEAEEEEKTARHPDLQHVRSSSCRVAAPAAAVAAAATWQPPPRRYPGGGRRRWGTGSRGGFTSALRWRSRPPRPWCVSQTKNGRKTAADRNGCLSFFPRAVFLCFAPTSSSSSYMSCVLFVLFLELFLFFSFLAARLDDRGAARAHRPDALDRRQHPTDGPAAATWQRRRQRRQQRGGGDGGGW